MTKKIVSGKFLFYSAACIVAACGLPYALWEGKYLLATVWVLILLSSGMSLAALLRQGRTD